MKDETVILNNLQEQLSTYRSELDQPVAVVADDLRVPAPRPESGTLERIHEIDAIVVRFNHLLVEFNREHAAAIASATDSPVGFAWRELLNSVNALRSWVHQWPVVRALLEEQLRGQRWPLVRRRSSRTGVRDTQESLTDDLFNALHLAINRRDQDESSAAFGAFGDIGLQNSVFTELMLGAYRVRLTLGGPTRFVDVGCGAGIKVMGAARFFHDVSGIELDPGYLTVARDLLKRAELWHADLIEGDALTFTHYSRYNLIYFFRPMGNHEKLLELEQKITKDASPFTLLIAPYAGFNQRYKKYGCQQIVKNMFVTGATREEARLIKRRAEYCGLAARPPRDPLPGVWQPILEASHANGFDMARPGRLDGV